MEAIARRMKRDLFISESPPNLKRKRLDLDVTGEILAQRMKRDLYISERPSRSNKEKLDVDLTSKIPDEILIYTLSRMSIKEAAKTSIVSHRWENLWKFYVGCLDFDVEMKNKALHLKSQEKFDMERRKFIDLVNQIVASHRGSILEQFRVVFDLGENHTNTINCWIIFAAARRVKRLELDLTSIHYCNTYISSIQDSKKMYTFPSPWWWLGRDLKWLTSLRLKYVSVTDDHVSYFLSNCPLLEELCIEGAPFLRNVMVVDAGHHLSRKLKHLEIRNCSWLEHLEVSAARNLVSFTYEGKFQPQRLSMRNMHFQDVPHLSSISLGCGDYCEHLAATSFKQFPFPIAQLQMLTIDLSYVKPFKPFNIPREDYKEFAQMTNLRQLELAFFWLDEQGMHFLLSLLLASPRLHKLVLKYQNYQYTTDCLKRMVKFWKTLRQQVERCKYECLKEVEFVGWSGAEGEIELFTHLIEAAESLERITIDPFHPCKAKHPQHIANAVITRNRARDLEAKIPPTTKFVVL